MRIGQPFAGSASISMPSRVPILLLAAVATLLSAAATAQEDAPSLGDVARTLRKSKSQSQPPVGHASGPSAGSSAETVIDNDNLAQVMEDVRKARPIKADKTVFSIDPGTSTVKLSSPDVTCSLSFNSRNSSLIIKPILIEDLPRAELLKLDGPGSIQDEALQLEVFNGTDWDLREITIGLTLERKPGENAERAANARIIPAAEGLAPPAIERHSDVTLLYHLKATAKPFSTTTFREEIGMAPGPEEDWRWSIVEAKGIRPVQSQPLPEASPAPVFATPSSILSAPGDTATAPEPAAAKPSASSNSSPF
jgi:hypothetical protein